MSVKHRGQSGFEKGREYDYIRPSHLPLLRRGLAVALYCLQLKVEKIASRTIAPLDTNTCRTYNERKSGPLYKLQQPGLRNVAPGINSIVKSSLTAFKIKFLQCSSWWVVLALDHRY